MKAKDKVALETLKKYQESIPGSKKRLRGANDTLTDDAALKNYAEAHETRQKMQLEIYIQQGRQDFGRRRTGTGKGD